MTTFGKRLDNLEQRKAFQEFLELKAQFDGRSEDEGTAQRRVWRHHRPAGSEDFPQKKMCVSHFLSPTGSCLIQFWF